MPSHYKGTEEERRALDLMIKLARASDSFLGRLQGPVLEAGLTMSGFGVLESLLHLGPLRPTEIAAKHLRSRSNLSVVIAHLERDGLIERVTCPTDRRAYYVHLTEAGRARVESVFPRFVAGLMREVSILSPEEQVQLGDLLRKLGRG